MSSFIIDPYRLAVVGGGGGSAPSIRSGQLSSRANSNTTDTFVAPASIVNGDRLLCVHAKDFIAADALTPPTGFTSISGLTEATDNTSGSGSNGARSECTLKTASGEAGNYVATTAQSERFAGYMAAIQGTSGVDVAAESIVSSNATACVMPTVTTTVDNCLLVYVLVQDDAAGGQTYTGPGGAVTDVAQVSISSGASVYIGTEVKATAGATTARTITSNTSDSYVARTIAFKP